MHAIEGGGILLLLRNARHCDYHSIPHNVAQLNTVKILIAQLQMQLQNFPPTMQSRSFAWPLT